MSGPAKSAARVALEQKHCSTCGAEPGQSCRPHQGADLVHGPRRGGSSTVGGKRSAERIRLEQNPCRFCGAEPGQSCRPAQGSKLVHADREVAGRIPLPPKHSW